MGNNAYTVIKKEQRNEKRNQLGSYSRADYVHNVYFLFSKGNPMKHGIGVSTERMVDYMDHETLRGINHAVSAACYMTKESDPPEIKKALLKAAEFLKLVNYHNPMSDSMLDVDYYLTDDNHPWRTWVITTTVKDGVMVCSEVVSGGFFTQVISKILASSPNLTCTEITSFFVGYDPKTTHMKIRYHLANMLKEGLVLSNNAGKGKTYRYYLPPHQQAFWGSKL